MEISLGLPLKFKQSLAAQQELEMRDPCADLRGCVMFQKYLWSWPKNLLGSFLTMSVQHKRGVTWSLLQIHEKQLREPCMCPCSCLWVTLRQTLDTPLKEHYPSSSSFLFISSVCLRFSFMFSFPLYHQFFLKHTRVPTLKVACVVDTFIHLPCEHHSSCSQGREVGRGR